MRSLEPDYGADRPAPVAIDPLLPGAGGNSCSANQPLNPIPLVAFPCRNRKNYKPNWRGPEPGKGLLETTRFQLRNC